MTFGQILLTIGLPTFIGAILIVPAWLVPRIRDISGLAGSALGVALGMALVVAFMAEAGVPSLPPAQKWHMLPIIACGIVILCPVVVLMDGSGEFGRWLISVATGAVIGWLAVFPQMDIFGRVLLGIWVGVSFMVMSLVSHRRRGITVTLSLTIVFTALAILCWQAHQITLTLINVALAATSGIGFVSALVAEVWTRDEEGNRRSIAIGWGGAFAAASLVPLTCFCGWAYTMGDVRWIHWALVGAAPTMLIIGELPWLKRHTGLGSSFVRVSMVCIPVALALVLLFTGARWDDESQSTETNIERIEHTFDSDY
ncbi:MAG: hypothetical protein VX527_09620 [Planctomycetota bacterium]|nr:hypothetical protein [Planctomycetota bacterium]